MDGVGLIELPEDLGKRTKNIYLRTAPTWVKREALLKPILAYLNQAGSITSKKAA